MKHKAEATGSVPAGSVQLVLTGVPAVQHGSAAVLPLVRLDAALLAYLAIEGATPRPRLLQLLWPDQAPESARNALRQRLFRLRRALGADLVRGAEQVALAEGVSTDLEAGEPALLQAHDYADCPEFDGWLQQQRFARRERWRAGCALRIEALEREGRADEAATWAERLVAHDGVDEAAVRQLMRLRYHLGQQALALAAFEHFSKLLSAEHGAAPAHETRALAETIRQASLPSLLPGASRQRTIPPSVLRPPRLVGRSSELAGLRAAWSGAQVFWLLGEAGLGKTRLMGDFLREWFDSAAPTLLAAARPGDSGVPYASLGRLLRSLIEQRPQLLEHTDRGELARVLPELAHAAPADAVAARPVALQTLIEALLRSAVADGLRAVVLDDLHFADPASLEMLPALVLADGLASLRWGFAQRPGEGAAAVEALRVTLEEAYRLEVIALAPLDEAQMAELLASLGLGDLDGLTGLTGLDGTQLPALLVRHTGGNPLFALETLKHLILDGSPRTAAGLPRPASVGQLIERRLRQLSPAALALARVAAVAGVDFSIDLAEQVLATRALALTDAWRELEAAQVLRQHAFAHDLVFEAVLAGIPQPIAAHTHGAVAAFLESRGSEAARVAAHWIAAGQPPRALAALHAAASAAQRAMRRKEQAGFLAQAARIEAGLASPALFDTLRAMVEALWVADRVALSSEAYDQLEAAAGTQQQRGVALAARATWLYECNDIEGAKRLCRQAIELADEAGDEATGVEARQRLAEVLHYGGEFEAAVALLQQLQPWVAERASPAEKVTFYGDLAIALDNADRGREAHVYHQRALDAGRQIGAWSDVVTVQGNLAISWATGGYMARAIELLQEALKLAAAHDEARGCGATLPIEIHNALRDCGRYGEAQRWIEPAMAAASGQMAAWQPLVRCQIACHWVHLGQHARAQREIEAALAARAPEWMRAKAFQMQARVRTAMGLRAHELVAQAHGLLARDGRRNLWASIVLDHALSLDAAAALCVACQVVAAGQRFETPAIALAGHIRAMRFAVDAGQAEAAAAHAAAGLALGDEVMPGDLYPAELWLNAWRALQFAGQEDASRRALQRGAAWVRTALEVHVPEPFKDSFVRANPVNQALLRAATALAC